MRPPPGPASKPAFIPEKSISPTMASRDSQSRSPTTSERVRRQARSWSLAPSRTSSSDPESPSSTEAHTHLSQLTIACQYSRSPPADASTMTRATLHIRWAGVSLRLITPCDPGTRGASTRPAPSASAPRPRMPPSYLPRPSAGPAGVRRKRHAICSPPAFLRAREDPEQPPPANTRREAELSPPAVAVLGRNRTRSSRKRPAPEVCIGTSVRLATSARAPDVRQRVNPSANNRSGQHLLVSATSAMQSRDHRCRSGRPQPRNTSRRAPPGVPRRGRLFVKAVYLKHLSWLLPSGLMRQHALRRDAILLDAVSGAQATERHGRERCA